MELKVLEKKKNRLVFEIKGADHTLCNSLKDELWNDKDVSVAAYNIGHPMKAIPKFILETKKNDPVKTVHAAVSRLQKQNKELKTAFAKL